ncbi:MAG: DUF1592 domain-containing protein [Deltaproteobacteria bacterium]|nr:DUF1592 domain-containing protein [Deltaproteobacteria bacterium]
MNRAEYDNTVRDLLLTSLQPSASFPFDDFGYGFDNIAEVLSISPLHLELYEIAADDLLDELLAATAPVASDVSRLEGELDLETTTGAASGASWNLWSNGTASAVVDLPSEGHYIVTARLWASQAGPDLAQATLLLDGAPLSTFDVVDAEEPGGLYTVEIDLANPGSHTFGVSFDNDFYDPIAGEDRNLYVDWLEIEGPTDQFDETPPGYAAIFTCDPASPGFDEEGCAEEIITAFAPRAWRRVVTGEEIDGLMGLYTFDRDSGGDWFEGVRTMLKTALLSPHFIYRVELDDNPTSPEARLLDGYELASRLSYFLWSSMPDDALFALAADDSLLEDEVLAAEIERMLADPRAEALVDNLAGQWLYIRAVDDAFPDSETFPDWDEDLRASMQEEMRRISLDLFLEDRSMLELFTGEETWIDARLAAHYGMPEPTADWERVSLTDDPRVGFLTTGGLLTSLSYPTRTSPVRRGKWVLGNLLCEAPPPPPAGVDTVLDGEVEGEALSLRDELEQHRADPVCASCHATMDPIGFAMENYDGIGAWRTEDDNAFPIDASGFLPGGAAFTDIGDLAAQLAADPESPGCMVEKTFTYALGRAPTVEDLVYLDAIEADFVTADHRFAALAAAIALSEPFRFKAGEP